MDFDYGLEKLNMAVYYLSGSESKSERLFNAVMYSLMNIKPEVELPEFLREEFAMLIAELTAVKAVADDERLLATINSFSDAELSQAIEKIIDLYNLACSYCTTE